MIDSISALSNHPIIENILASLVAYVDKAEGDVQHTVREFLYDGYDDELFGLYANLTRFCKYEILNDICQNLPQVPAKMGFFYGVIYLWGYP